LNEENIDKVFSMFDKNGDGSLDVSELKEVFADRNEDSTKEDDIWA